MYRVSEVAEKLSISLSMAYGLIADGSLPSYRIGTAVRVSEEDLETYLAGCRTAGPKAVKPPAPRPRAILKHLRL